jgi:hypothetical protein
LVPFSAQPIVSDSRGDASDAIEIVSHHPLDTQWAEVARLKGTKDVVLKPTVSISALGNGGSLDGLGVTKHLDINQVSTISLKPTQVVLQNSPVQLQWYVDHWKDSSSSEPGLAS